MNVMIYSFTFWTFFSLKIYLSSDEENFSIKNRQMKNIY